MAKNGERMLSGVDLRVADATDEELKAIIEVRKRYAPEDRETLIKGLIYISRADGEYADYEKQIVESTACSLGINREKIDSLFEETAGRKYWEIFSVISNTRFRELFFSELIDLTYIKGFQTQSEENELKLIARYIGILDKKTETMLENGYFTAQGIDRRIGTASVAAKAGITIGAVVVGAAIMALTAGAAAPAIGAVFGNAAGLSGAAATAHGLAFLGGGALAAGGGVAAGTAAIVTAGGIIGAGTGAISMSVAGNIANAHDKKQLKAYVIKEMKAKKTEQEITENLIEAIEIQKERIKALEEAHASQRDIMHASETIENLISQVNSVSEVFGKNNGKK